MKTTKLFYATGACIAALCFTSCNNNDDDVRYMLPETRAIQLTEEQKDMVKSNNDFSFNLLRTAYNQRQTASEKGKSIFLSPTGVTYMLGMVANGASGETPKEINDALGFAGNSPSEVNNLCRTLIEEAPNTDKNVKLEIANAIYTNKGYTLNEQFKTNINTYYKADAQTLDFAAPASLKTINDWARQNTHGMIPQFLGQLKPDAIAYLLNTIYFQATWTKQFDREKTKTETFTKEDGTERQLQMMNNEALILSYENDDCRMVCLPYGSGAAWNMFVLLPKDGKTVEMVLNNMDNEYWNSLIHTINAKKLELKLPKFITTDSHNLHYILPKMNVSKVFNSNFGLNRICPGKNVHISDMLQSGRIEVSEEGTKATAVTLSSLMDGASGPEPGGSPEIDQRLFHATKPFIYLICENSTNAVFFAGVYQGD